MISERGSISDNMTPVYFIFSAYLFLFLFLFLFFNLY